MRRSHTLQFLGFVGLAVTGCGVPWRHQPTPPPCNESQAATLDTARWRSFVGGRYPSLALPPEFAYDRSLIIICYHGGVMWSDSTAPSATRHLRFVGWCHEDGMPNVDVPDSVVWRLPVRRATRADGEVCQLSFPVLGQRMGLLRRGGPTVYEWISWPLQHGEPFYLFARSPSAADEAVIIRSLQGIRWTR